MRVDREVEVGGAQSAGEERTIIEVYIIGEILCTY